MNIQPRSMKPRIRQLPSGRWLCYSDSIKCFGSTPASAYRQWKEITAEYD